MLIKKKFNKTKQKVTLLPKTTKNKHIWGTEKAKKEKEIHIL
jgi:hypothetical protein